VRKHRRKRLGSGRDAAEVIARVVEIPFHDVR